MMAATLRARSKKIPLRLVLIASFVVQIVGTVGLVGYLSLRNGEKAVADIAQQLMEETGNRIEQKLTAFEETPHLINQLNADARAVPESEPSRSIPVYAR